MALNMDVPSQNGSRAPLTASTPPSTIDFNEVIKQAQQSGDYAFLITTAEQTQDMLVDFRDAIQQGTFPGTVAVATAMGLKFIDQMVVQSAQQLEKLRQAAKATATAKTAVKSQGDAGQ